MTLRTCVDCVPELHIQCLISVLLVKGGVVCKWLEHATKFNLKVILLLLDDVLLSKLQSIL